MLGSWSGPRKKRVSHPAWSSSSFGGAFGKECKTVLPVERPAPSWVFRAHLVYAKPLTNVESQSDKLKPLLITDNWWINTPANKKGFKPVLWTS
jgi:hypothetical protein